MSVTRIPVLVWKDFSGLFTASVVEQPDIAAVSESVQDCLSQLRHFLTWTQRNEPWMFPELDLDEPDLTRVQVDVRPEYVAGRQRHPSAPIRLNVPCIYGKVASELYACSIPTMRLWFSFHQIDKLKELATHYVREALQGKSPQQVERFLNVSEHQLEEVVVTEQRPRTSQAVNKYEALEAVAEALGERAIRKQFARAWEREDVIAQILDRVTQDNANVLLVGPPGVGKTSIIASVVREIERRIEGGQERRKFWLTNGSRLIAGTPYLGQWEERLEGLISELAGFQGVLCIENLLELLNLGGSDATDSVGAFLVPYMNHREVQIIAEATVEELNACRRILPGLSDAFQIVPVDPFDDQRALKVLDRIAQSESRNLRVEVGNEVVDSIYRLFRRFRPYDAFPGKAAAFTTELIRRIDAKQQSKLETNSVLARFIDETGLPERFLRDDVPLRESEVLAQLSGRVIGQEEACRAAASVITTFKAGLNDPTRPLGVLLFSGPTGVGKTELSRSISDFLFGHGGSSDRLVRLDMSEYSGHGASERLITDSRGNASDFLKRVRNQPFCVVLLDEIEKGSPDVFDMLLGLFDEGRLTDRFGRVTNFQSAVVIMTSNLGAGRDSGLGFGQDRGPDYDAEVMRFFRPEFYNRLDGVVAFQPLGKESIIKIAEKELSELAKREGFAKAGIRLSWDSEVAHVLAKVGFNHRYGARPLQRALEELVVTPLARHLAENTELKNTRIHLMISSEGQVEFS